MSDDILIERIRDASRRLVREFGFMRPNLAGSPLPPSAVHALIELGLHGTRTGADLAASLHLDKSSVSRLLGKLVSAGEIAEGATPDDGRKKPFALTRKGQATLAAINAYARGQVSSALDRLTPENAATVHDGLSLYADALASDRNAASIPSTIVTGYRPGIVGWCTEAQIRYYARTVGFGATFEAKVASGLADFIPRLERPKNRLWIAMRADRFVGTIAVDGEDLGGTAAHLRWFIVGDGQRGTGIGRRLLRDAMDFCDAAGFTETHLWTLKGLDAARHLYEAEGFRLTEEWVGDQWGQPIAEQRFVRIRRTAGSTAR